VCKVIPKNEQLKCLTD